MNGLLHLLIDEELHKVPTLLLATPIVLPTNVVVIFVVPNAIIYFFNCLISNSNSATLFLRIVTSSATSFTPPIK